MNNCEFAGIVVSRWRDLSILCLRVHRHIRKLQRFCLLRQRAQRVFLDEVITRAEVRAALDRGYPDRGVLLLVSITRLWSTVDGGFVVGACPKQLPECFVRLCMRRQLCRLALHDSTAIREGFVSWVFIETSPQRLRAIWSRRRTGMMRQTAPRSLVLGSYTHRGHGVLRAVIRIPPRGSLIIDSDEAQGPWDGKNMHGIFAIG
eukprot:338261-Amphidinium_carterae.5